MPAPIRFVYFDLGNVLLNFDHDVAARQIGELTGIGQQRAREVVFDGDLQVRYECGEITTREFYDSFCELTKTQPDYEALLHAASAMFEVNASSIPIVAQLRAAGYRLGIISNTCQAHWDYVSRGRYAMIPSMFDEVVLSFRAGCMKPAAKIYNVASDVAKVAPAEIFFTDDREENVQGAIDAGLNAVLYVSASDLAAGMHERGIRINY